MFPEMGITGTNDNTCNGKGKNKDHNDNNRPADKV